MIRKQSVGFFGVFCGLALLAGCSQSPSKDQDLSDSDKYQLNRYSIKQDRSPVSFPKPHEIKDAEPKVEPIKKAGNYSPYTVFGNTYHVMDDASGYKKRGTASWYGLKFHGHKTSNGEIYSIYEMTAAHKTLPIPSYVKVTNLSNNRTCIVRVNDRGPFHGDRMIDLSYAAATKLGYTGQGTTEVEIEVIDPNAWLARKEAEKKANNPVRSQQDAQPIYLQVGAYSQLAIATETFNRLYAQYDFPVILKAGAEAGDFHRIHIGPLAEHQVANVQEQLVATGYPKPVRVKIQP